MIISKENIDKDIEPATPSLDAAVQDTPEPASRVAPDGPSRYIVIILSLLTIALTLRYVVWRLEVNAWHMWWLSVPLLLAELFTAMHILGYQYTVWPRESQ